MLSLYLLLYCQCEYTLSLHKLAETAENKSEQKSCNVSSAEDKCIAARTEKLMIVA